MAKKIKALAVLILIFLCAGSGFAQEEGGLDFGLSLGFGAETIDGKMWQTLKLTPDLAVGKFGIGVELNLHYTLEPEAQILGSDWIPTDDYTLLELYLPKFKYIRYGFKGDPLYAQFGSIDYALLGNGFIIREYDNAMFLPLYQDREVFGLSFDLDGALFNFPYVGIETFVGNMAELDVLGSRLYIRPLAFTDVPVISGLQVGGTFAMDRKPGLYNVTAGAADPDDSLDPVLLYGADLTLPIIQKPAFTLTSFADIAFLDNTLGPGNKGKGEMVGFRGRIFRFMSYGAQIRVLGEDFIPTYFDHSYDLNRESNFDEVQAGSRESSIGWLGSLGFAFFDDALLFRVTVDGPFDVSGASSYLDWPHLYAVFILGEGIIPNVSLEAQFDKRSLGDPGVAFYDDSVLGAKVNYSVGPAVISVLYQATFDAATSTWDSKSGIEGSFQLF